MVFSGFIHKTQHRTVGFLPSMGGVIPHTTPLLIPINRFRGGIDAKVNPSILQFAKMSGPLPNNPADVENRVGLIDAQAVHISPKSAGCRQTVKVEKSTNYRIQTDIHKMPQPIETDEQQHQKPYHNAVVTQFGFSTRPTAYSIGNLFKVEQIERLDQSKKPPNRLSRSVHGTQKVFYFFIHPCCKIEEES